MRAWIYPAWPGVSVAVSLNAVVPPLQVEASDATEVPVASKFDFVVVTMLPSVDEPEPKNSNSAHISSVNGKVAALP